MSLWELTAAIEGYQEAHSSKEGRAPAPLSDEEITELDAVIDEHNGN